MIFCLLHSQLAHGCPKGWRKALCLNPPPQVPLWAHLPGTTSIFLKKLLPCFQACVLWAIFFWINSLCSILKSNSFKLFLNKSLFWIYCGPAKVAIVMPGSVRIITQLESPLYLIGIYAASGWQDFGLFSFSLKFLEHQISFPKKWSKFQNLAYFITV